MKAITRFLWLCSGSSSKIIERHPTESSKYAGIGATILFTGIFAALSSGYAFYTVFDNYWIAAGSGILWGAMIFNLDRYIVSSMRKRSKRSSDLLMASPRIILAVLIALVISKPLELKIFEKEVNNELVLMQQEMRSNQESAVAERFNNGISVYEAENDRLRQEITDQEAVRDHLADEAIKEADGTGGTMQRNAGPIYRLKKEEADKAETELGELRAANELAISKNQSRIDSLRNVIGAEIAAIEEEAYDGLASRLEALDRITTKSAAISLANWFIILLFIAIETAPIFVKLISSKGPYDDRLQVHEHLSHVVRSQHMSRENHEAKKQGKTLGEHEKDWLESELGRSLR